MTTKLRQLTLAAAAILLALGLGAGVYAASQTTSQPSSQQNTAPAGRPFMGGMGRWAQPFGGLQMMALRLGLTDAQRDQIKTIARSHRDEWKALGDRALTARQALSAAIGADTIDEAAIRQRSADLAAVESDIAVARAYARAEILQVLTSDQQAQAKALQEQFQQRIGQRRKHD